MYYVLRWYGDDVNDEWTICLKSCVLWMISNPVLRCVFGDCLKHYLIVIFLFIYIFCFDLNGVDGSVCTHASAQRIASSASSNRFAYPASRIHYIRSHLNMQTGKKTHEKAIRRWARTYPMCHDNNDVSLYIYFIRCMEQRNVWRGGGGARARVCRTENW